MPSNTLVGTAVTVSPIRAGDMERIPLDCWSEDPGAIRRLFDEQETVGMAAWEGDRCVAELHCYRISPPQWENASFPEWTRDRGHLWPLGWPLQMVRTLDLQFDGPVWAHACFHVGRLRADDGMAHPSDPSYFGRGIGTALCKASIQWARDHGYAAVLALGGPKELFEYACWFGVLPWTTYARQGFDTLAIEEDGERLAPWTQGDAPPLVTEQIEAALAVGRPVEDLCGRLMLLDLGGVRRP